MSDTQPVPPKPISEIYRSEIVRLPKLTPTRKLVRRLLKLLVRFLVWLLTDLKVTGLENVPAEGGLLAVANHLGDADIVLGLAFSPRPLDVFAKADLYDFPVLGKLMDAYGVIWLHRGRADRRAIRAGLAGLEEGRMIVIAPEGRESVTGALEEGTSGAAYLAFKAGVLILPVAMTGTENRNLYGNLRRFRRTPITATIGPPFRLDPGDERRNNVAAGTDQIMQTIAKMLPEAYRGVYTEGGQT